MAYTEYDQFFYNDRIEEFEDALQPDKTDMKEEYDKDKLYCPECHKARLRFTRRTSKHRAYLSTWQGDQHRLNCSYSFEPASKHQTKEYYKNLSPAQITDKLEAAINAIRRREQRNMTDCDENDLDRNPAIAQITQNNGEQKTYRLLTKSIYNIKKVPKEAYDMPILFYGRVLLSVKEQEAKKGYKSPYYFLQIHNPLTRNMICSFYRGKHKDDINEDQVYLISVLAVISEDENSRPKKHLYPPNSLLYQTP